MKTKLDGVFAGYGLELQGFQVQNISLPEEIQKFLDQRIGMDVLGDMRRLTQYNTAQSIPIAAANEGGAAGLGAGLGAGLSIGQTMASNMADAMRGGGSTVQGPADVTALLEKLHELLTKGVLTQEEFDTKKAELLKKIT
jgi:membrane protease subunit (stomatin/prohibitin family)